MLVTFKTFLLPLGMLLFLIVFTVNGQLNGITIDVGDYRYVIKKQSLTWFKANLACSAIGMSLASIETEAINKDLRNTLLTRELLGTDYWLSGANLADTNSYEFSWFSSGNKFEYTNWQSSPSVSTADKCVYANSIFKWAIDNCDTVTKYYICSRPLLPNCGITGRCKKNKNFF